MDIENNLMVTKEKRAEGEIRSFTNQVHTSICKIMNKDLPHGMGNYLQYTVITHKEKESEK